METNSNFFNVNPINRQKAFSENFAEETHYSGQRLNGYDTGLLNEKNTPYPERLKLEYRINETQNALTEVTGKIKNAEIYGSQSEVLSLKVRKQRLEKELIDLNRQNMESKRLSAAGEVFEISWIRKVQNFLSRHILSKFSKKINSVVFLGDSLEKLSDINRNVDALIESNVPYGEKNDNYEKLTEYLTQANKIRSEITNRLNG